MSRKKWEMLLTTKRALCYSLKCTIMERYAVLEALLLLQGSFHLREATCQNLCLYGVLATATITGIIEMQEKSRL